MKHLIILCLIHNVFNSGPRTSLFQFKAYAVPDRLKQVSEADDFQKQMTSTQKIDTSTGDFINQNETFVENVKPAEVHEWLVYEKNLKSENLEYIPPRLIYEYNIANFQKAYSPVKFIVFWKMSDGSNQIQIVEKEKIRSPHPLVDEYKPTVNNVFLKFSEFKKLFRYITANELFKINRATNYFEMDDRDYKIYATKNFDMVHLYKVTKVIRDEYEQQIFGVSFDIREINQLIKNSSSLMNDLRLL